MTTQPPLIAMNANCVPTDPDLERLVQAAYDTGYYAGIGRSGSNAHKAMMAKRNDVWRKVATKRTAADALFIASKDAAKFVAKYVADSESVIGKRALDRLEQRLHEYEAAK